MSLSALRATARGGLNLALAGIPFADQRAGVCQLAGQSVELIYRGSLVHGDYSWRVGGRLRSKFYSDCNNFYLNCRPAMPAATASMAPAWWRIWRPVSLAQRQQRELFTQPAIQPAGRGGVRKRTNEEYELRTDVRTPPLMQADESSETALYLQGDYSWGTGVCSPAGGTPASATAKGTARRYAPPAGLSYTGSTRCQLAQAAVFGRFNVPNALQVCVKTPVLNGNRDLRPEQVAGTDLAYTWSQGNTLFVITATICAAGISSAGAI